MDQPRPLRGFRILVPPGRPHANPVLTLLARAGAEAIGFPALAVAPPSHRERMDAALRGLGSFRWVVFSGRDAVSNFFERGEAMREPLPPGVRVGVAAIGQGAVAALSRRGARPDLVPERHTPGAVAGSFPDLAGADVLLVRAEGATKALPEALAARGAKVSEAGAYAVVVSAEESAREEVFGRRLDAVALASGTAVRMLVAGLDRIGLAPADVDAEIVAAVGESTADVAREAGWKPNLVAGGRVADLARELTDALTP